MFVFSVGQLEFRHRDGGKHIRCICPNVLDSSYIQVKAFCGGLYCFTRTVKMNSSITADLMCPLLVHCGFMTTKQQWKYVFINVQFRGSLEPGNEPSATFKHYWIFCNMQKFSFMKSTST